MLFIIMYGERKENILSWTLFHKYYIFFYTIPKKTSFSFISQSMNCLLLVSLFYLFKIHFLIHFF